jgi:glycosyltransferase involved in cell wall biosynthesis
MDLSAPARFHCATDPGGRANLLLRVEAAPAPALEICVIIPAKNEAEGLPATLAALAAQVQPDGQPLPPGAFEIILLANNCTDQTAAVARAFGRQHPQLRLHVLETLLPAAEAHVGRARRLLMDEAARRLELTGRPRGIIASTDADTRVAPDWLAALQAEFRAGADAVGGRILPEAPPAARCPARRLHLRDAAYRLCLARLEHLLDPSAADPWPRHHQHFGGSLALTVAAYRRVGGLPVLPHLEDEALCQLLLRHDQRLRHSPAVRVHTSARQQGRVAVGLSWQLRCWADDASAGREPLAEHPRRLAAEWQARRQLRAVWQQWQSGQRAAVWAGLPAIATLLSITPAEMLTALAQAATFGALWETVLPAAVAAWAIQWPAVPLAAATAELRRQLAAAEASALGQQIEPVLFRPVAVPVLQGASFPA